MKVLDPLDGPGRRKPRVGPSIPLAWGRRSVDDHARCIGQQVCHLEIGPPTLDSSHTVCRGGILTPREQTPLDLRGGSLSGRDLVVKDHVAQVHVFRRLHEHQVTPVGLQERSVRVSGLTADIVIVWRQERLLDPAALRNVLPAQPLAVVLPPDGAFLVHRGLPPTVDEEGVPAGRALIPGRQVVLRLR